MKPISDQLRALAVAPEFEETTTAKLFLEIADRADALERESAKLREERDAARSENATLVAEYVQTWQELKRLEILSVENTKLWEG